MARVVVAGYVVRYPLAGNVWAHLQYVIGLARLGHEVWYLEEAGWEDSCYLPEEDTMTSDPTYGKRVLQGLLRDLGLDVRWGYRDSSRQWHGSLEVPVEDLMASADLFLDVGGASHFPEMHAARRRAYVDMDPLFTQLGGFAHWRLGEYDTHFTYGTNIGRADCPIPTLGYRWHPLLPPVALDIWQRTEEAIFPPECWTTVATWAAYEPAEHEGENYGQKDIEFRRFIDLPSRAPRCLEVALGGADAPYDLFQRHGWRLADPRAVSTDPWRYRRYLWNSRGEFSVAKHGYVATGSGWFSDRTASYLASGLPAVVQDTGIGHTLPLGYGLLTFSTPQEAIAALGAADAGYADHKLAARSLAETYLDARKVLTELLDVCGA